MSVKAAEVSRRFQTLWACKELRARSSSLLRLCHERSSARLLLAVERCFIIAREQRFSRH
jgi:hypothetical protein